MNATLQAIRQRLLSVRLRNAFVLVIFLTAVVVGLPAYGLVRAELERQAWAQVTEGEQTTLALLQAEKGRIDGLAALTSQCATLQGLLKDGDTAALTDYLQTYQVGTIKTDILVAHDSTGQPLVVSAASMRCAHLRRQTEADFCVLPGAIPRVSLLADHSVRENGSGKLLGYVTAGTILNNAFEQKLAAATGLAQSIILDGNRAATSLKNPSSAVNAQALKQVINSGEPAREVTMVDGVTYYTELFPLRDTQENIVALAEVALPVAGLVAAERQALLLMLGGALLVALVGSALGRFYEAREGAFG